jgi:hypothetical protein
MVMTLTRSALAISPLRAFATCQNASPLTHRLRSAESLRIAQLQLENVRLRKLVTDLLLEKMRLEDGQAELRVGRRKGKLDK